MLAADHSCLLCLRSQIDFLLQMISMLLTVLTGKVNTSQLYSKCSFRGYPHLTMFSMPSQIAKEQNIKIFG